MPLSFYEQYLYHCRVWITEYHLSLTEIENTEIDLLLDIELLDSKIDSAFAEKKNKKFYIDDLL